MGSFFSLKFKTLSLRATKHTTQGVLLLVNLQTKTYNLTVTFIHECFSHFLNCTNGIKSRNVP